MRSFLIFTSSLLLSVCVFAFPKTVQVSGAFHSKRGTTENVVINLTLKKQSATKAKYSGRASLSDNLMAQDQTVTLTINTAKGKTEGLLNLMDGYMAFDTKVAYTLNLNEQWQLQYSEYHDEPQMPCNPINDNFCHPGQQMPQLTDTGLLNLTVVQAQ